MITSVPLNLHPSCAARLEEILAGTIGALHTTYGITIDWRSAEALRPVDAVLPKRLGHPLLLAAMIDERPLSDFALDRITRKLDEVGTFIDVDTPAPIVELAAFADTAAVAKEIVGEFASLPWDYLVSLRLPDRLASTLRLCFDESGRMDVGAGIALVRGVEALATELPLPTLTSTLGLLPGVGTGWEADAVYLQVPLSGYIDRYGATGTALQAVETLHMFLGLGIALRLFVYQIAYTPSAFGPPRNPYHIHRHTAGGWVYDTTINQETTAVMGLEGFTCHDFSDFLFLNEGKPTFCMIVQNVLASMGACFTHRDKAERILRAAQWLAGCYMSRNETLAFVQAMVALEILLGDKKITDMVGIGELLSNRAAYLIGDSQADREQVLDDFRTLYSVRSDIVHSGKSRLSHSERLKFYRLLYICGRAIMEEINLLKKNQAA